MRNFERYGDEDPIDSQIRRTIQESNPKIDIKYLGAPTSYYEALEILFEQYDILSKNTRQLDMCIGYRISCETGAYVMMIWIPGVKQFHINLRLVDDFLTETFEEDVLEYTGITALDIDDYLAQ